MKLSDKIALISAIIAGIGVYIAYLEYSKLPESSETKKVYEKPIIIRDTKLLETKISHVKYGEKAYEQVKLDLSRSNCKCYQKKQVSLAWWGLVDKQENCQIVFQLYMYSSTNDMPNFLNYCSDSGNCFAKDKPLNAKILEYDSSKQKGEILIKWTTCQIYPTIKDKIFKFMFFDDFSKLVVKADEPIVYECLYMGEYAYKYMHKNTVRDVPQLKNASIEKWIEFYDQK